MSRGHVQPNDERSGAISSPFFVLVIAEKFSQLLRLEFKFVTRVLPYGLFVVDVIVLLHMRKRESGMFRLTLAKYPFILIPQHKKE